MIAAYKTGTKNKQGQNVSDKTAEAWHLRCRRRLAVAVVSQTKLLASDFAESLRSFKNALRNPGMLVHNRQKLTECRSRYYYNNKLIIVAFTHSPPLLKNLTLTLSSFFLCSPLPPSSSPRFSFFNVLIKEEYGLLRWVYTDPFARSTLLVYDKLRQEGEGKGTLGTATLSFYPWVTSVVEQAVKDLPAEELAVLKAEIEKEYSPNPNDGKFTAENTSLQDFIWRDSQEVEQLRQIRHKKRSEERNDDGRGGGYNSDQSSEQLLNNNTPAHSPLVPENDADGGGEGDRRRAETAARAAVTRTYIDNERGGNDEEAAAQHEDGDDEQQICFSLGHGQKKVAVTRLTASWAIKNLVDNTSTDLQRLFFRATLQMNIQRFEKQMSSLKCIYFVLPTSLLNEISSCFISMTTAEQDLTPLAIKFGRASGQNEKSFKINTLERYRKIMSKPFMFQQMLTYLHPRELDAIEAVYKGQTLQLIVLISSQ